jgi:hypothetical protein
MSEIRIQSFPNGVTVKELKEAIKDWPEIDHYTGDPTEVWIGTQDDRSNQARTICPLNMRIDDEKTSADLLLEVK